LVVPERTKKVRQLKIPKLLVKMSVLALILLLAFTVIVTKEYLSVKKDFKEEFVNYNDIKRESFIKSGQIKFMSEKIDKITTQIDSIEKLNSQIRILANLEMPETSNKSLGIGGPSPEVFDELSILNENEERTIKQFYSTADKLRTRIVLEEESLLDLINFLGDQKSFLASTPSVWPTRGVKTSNFGFRVSPFTGKRSFHNGIDLSAREGTPIIAPADGIVKFARDEFTYGNLVIIDHGYGITTKYGHLLTFFVEPGQKVRRGDKIGLVGNTGRSTGSHLHYEIRVSKVPVNPLKYILN
jgi:murein DD-endopeptidase MepM/ murein hydrolase activator NlpD